MSIRDFPTLPALLVLLTASAVQAQEQEQEQAPIHLAALEAARSRACVDVLTQVERLDTQLFPYAGRAQRLLGIAGAIEIEETSVVDSLRASDPLEAEVAAWFRADQALARQYLDGQGQAILDQRAAGRRDIQDRLRAAIDSVQAQADSILATYEDLGPRATACSGSILVRGAAVEACEGVTSRICTAARDSTASEPFRFVDSADMLWFRQEFRPWSAPTPLQVTPQGQLGGARTVGSTRVGNIVLTVALSPLLRARREISPEQLATLDSIDAALGLESTHPDVTFVPAISIQANLSEKLDEEDYYALHFGPPDTPDILWIAEAGTGQPLAGSVAMAPAHVALLRAGEPITLTAVREREDGEPEGLWAIELSSVNQVPPVEALLGYMAQQLSADLVRAIPPSAPDAPAN